MSFDLGARAFNIDSMRGLQTKPALYPVSVTLTDEYGASKTYTFTVHLRPEQIEDPNAIKYGDILREDTLDYKLSNDDFVEQPFEEVQLEKIREEAKEKVFKVSRGGLGAKMGKVGFDGTFNVKWTEQIFGVRKDTLVNKNAV